jgi:hypothetical protein
LPAAKAGSPLSNEENCTAPRHSQVFRKMARFRKSQPTECPASSVWPGGAIPEPSFSSVTYISGDASYRTFSPEP